MTVFNILWIFCQLTLSESSSHVNINHVDSKYKYINLLYDLIYVLLLPGWTSHLCPSASFTIIVLQFPPNLPLGEQVLDQRDRDPPASCPALRPSHRTPSPSPHYCPLHPNVIAQSTPGKKSLSTWETGGHLVSFTF